MSSVKQLTYEERRKTQATQWAEAADTAVLVAEIALGMGTPGSAASYPSSFTGDAAHIELNARIPTPTKKRTR